MNTQSFNLLARILHWIMAVLILSMLFIGVTMVASMEHRVWLIDLHRPLGIAILLLAFARLANRLTHKPPPLPADLPKLQVIAALGSHWLLYALMIAMPILGWATVSAAGEPVTMFGRIQLPPIAPHNPETYAFVRTAHGWLSRVLFVTVLLHLSAALYHAWVRRDGVFSSMVKSRR